MVVRLSSRKFLFACLIVSGIILLWGRITAIPLWLLAAEVFATILGLFVFGSFKYQIHKNALTYGMLLVIVATFCGLSTSQWHAEIAQSGWWLWAQRTCCRLTAWMILSMPTRCSLSSASPSLFR